MQFYYHMYIITNLIRPSILSLQLYSLPLDSLLICRFVYTRIWIYLCFEKLRNNHLMKQNEDQVRPLWLVLGCRRSICQPWASLEISQQNIGVCPGLQSEDFDTPNWHLKNRISADFWTQNTIVHWWPPRVHVESLMFDNFDASDLHRKFFPNF